MSKLLLAICLFAIAFVDLRERGQWQNNTTWFERMLHQNEIPNTTEGYE